MKRKTIFQGGGFAVILALALSACTKNSPLITPGQQLVSGILPSTANSFSIDPTATHIPLPASVAASYSTSLNTSVSDDFNDATVDFTKWQYRTDGTAKWGTTSAYVYTASTGSDHFVVLKGSDSAGKGSGITSKTNVKYGFYMVRWQAIGWSGTTANGWHPSIWGAACDFSGPGNGNCIPEVAAHGLYLEADFIEGFNGDNPYWKSHLLLWNNSAIYIDIAMKPSTTTWPNTATQWVTMGYEYTPAYMAIWEYASGTWTKIKQVSITTAGSTQTNVNTAYRTPLYWILSNNYIDATRVTNDSWLHVDYFYLYDYTGS